MSHRIRTTFPVNKRPDFSARKPLPLREIPPSDREQRAMLNEANSYLRAYVLGECPIFVTKEFGKYHLSISHRDRYPTWAEISEAWYRIIPNAGATCGALILPPIHEFVNMAKFCMHVVEIDQ